MSYDLQRGQVIEVDVRGIDQVILFTMNSRRGTYHKMPSVSVTEEEGGFTVTILSVVLGSSKEGPDGVLVDSYEISIRWTPGADHSGAYVSVIYPDTDEEARAHIYMMFP